MIIEKTATYKKNIFLITKKIVTLNCKYSIGQADVR